MSKLRLLAICLILPAALFVRSFAFVSMVLAVGDYSDAPFCIPTTGYVTQLYHSGHKAIDIGKGSGKGPAIYAPYSGKIIYVGRGFAWEGNYPNIYPRHAVVINHGKVNGKHVASFFAHMGANGNPSKKIKPVSYITPSILNGTLKTVSMGTLIGYQGTAGVATGTHTHFAVRVKTSSTPFYSWNVWTTGSWINPKSYIVGSSSLSVWDYLETNCGASGGSCSIAPGQGSSRQVFFQQAYDRKGGRKVMGCATTGAFWWAGMVRQDFEGSPGFGRAAILHDEPADNPKFSIPAYVVQGGFWGWYKNNPVFGPPASDHYINAFGLPQTDFRDGFIYWMGGVNPRRYLLKGSGPKVYFIERGRKRWVPNSETLFALGYTWSNVQTIPNSALAVFPTGDPIPNVNDTWLAQYYDNMVNRRPAKVIRGEGDLNFGWGLGSPHYLIPEDNFSARFVKYVNFPVSGRYRFHIVKDDGGRLWIGGKKIFDKWCHTLACVGHFTVDQDINAGTHLVRFDYYEKGVSATASLWWDTLDKEGPQVSASFSSTAQGGSGWYQAPVTVTLSASDPSGVDRIEYRLDSSWQLYKKPVILSGDGVYQFQFRAYDRHGNQSSIYNEQVKIDKTPPSSSLQTTNPYQSSLPFSIPVSASDGESGISRIGLYKRRVGEKKWQHHWTSRSGSIPEYFNIGTLDEGRWEFASRATDLAGNKEELPQEPDVSLVLDQTPPQTTLSVNGPSHQKEDKLFVSPQTEFELTADDTNQTDPSIETSGVAQTNYQIDKDEEQIYEGEFPIENEDGKHEIKYQSDDVAGNEEPQKSQEVYLDSTPPTSTDDSDGEWHNEDVAVLIVSSDGEGSGVKAIYYSDARTSMAKDDEVVVVFKDEGVHELSYYAVDNVENVEGVKHAALVKIDKTPPRITGAPLTEPNKNGWYSEDVVVHFEAEDQLDLSGLKSVTPDTIISTEGKDQEVTGTAEDNAGNTTSTTVGGINIDKTEPSSEITFPEEEEYYNQESWEQGGGAIIGTASDNLSGIGSVEVEVEGVEEGEAQLEDYGELETGWEYSLRFARDGFDDGEYTVRSCATDMAENQESTDEVTFIYDNTPPTSTITSLEENAYYNAGTWPGIFGTAGDNLSGVAQVEVRIDKDGEEGAWVVAEGTEDWSFDLTPEDGFYTVYSRATDSAGNQESTDEISFVYDATPPVTSVELSGTDGLSSWYVSKVALSLSAEDLTSGIVQVFYSTEGSGPQVYEDLLTFGDGYHTVEFWAVDLAGNEEEHQIVSFKIDQTPPEITGMAIEDPNESGWYNDDVVVQFRATDKTSGVALVTEDQVIETEGAGQSVEGVAVDFAGNSSTILVGGINIDQTPPSSQLNELDLYYNNPFELTYTYLDNLSGVERARLYKRVPGEDWGYHGGSSRKPSKPFKVGTLSEGRWEFASVAIDYAGNIEVLPGEADTCTIYDITPPTSAITSIEESAYYNADSWPGMIYGVANDNLSGVAQVEVRVDKDGEEGNWEPAWETTGWSLPGFIPSDGFYTVYSRATDRAGNQESTFKVSFTYDNTSPVTSAELSGTEGLNGWHVSLVTLTLNSFDKTSGVKQTNVIIIKDGEGDYHTLQYDSGSLPAFEDGRYVVEFWSVDLAGNEEEHQMISFKIDSVAPQAPMVSIPGGTFTEGEILRVSLAAEEGAEIYYSLDDSEPILYSNLIAITGDATLSVYAIDEAGNRSASVEFNYVFSAKGGSALGGNPASQVLGVQSQETPGVSQGRNLVDGVAGVKGEETSTPVGEPNPKGLGGWEILLVIILGGVPYFLLRRRVLLKK